jgi:hypothetical protein
VVLSQVCSKHFPLTDIFPIIGMQGMKNHNFDAQILLYYIDFRAKK